MHPCPISAGGRGLSLQQNFQKGGGGGLTGPQLLQGFAGNERVTFFWGRDYNFHQKKKKSEIFNDKKSL